MSLTRFRRVAVAGASAGILLIVVTATAEAHVVKDFGPYSVALGWSIEPTYVGQINAVQVVVKDKAGKAVTDLGDGDLKVVVGFGGEQSQPLSLDNKFDEDTGLGIPGDYEAPLTPTAPGDYAFHLTGSIHGQAVDETATSSDSTFNSAVEARDIQFPNKLPSLTEITTSLDRINARLAAAASAAPSAASSAPAAAPSGDTALNDAVSAAQSTASEARDGASTALAVGLIVGVLGVILGGAALLLVLRRPRQA